VIFSGLVTWIPRMIPFILVKYKGLPTIVERFLKFLPVSIIFALILSSVVTGKVEFFDQDSFDKILVDAPCSGIGLLRRKPDIKYNKETADFASLQEIQLEILGSVCQILGKGGIITYSTCTIVSEENFQVVKAFLESHPEFEQVKLEHECKDIMKDGCILITPELYGSDGFFISQFRKISD
ncbi:AzlD domain-containing protein, partial [Burkholderia cenocepacia]|nr:AzlD domain-containing protein [Burkholderia cenocepacia]